MCVPSRNKHFSLNLFIVRLAKIMNRADKNWAQFQEMKYLKNPKFQKYFLIKVGLLVKDSSQNFFFGKIQPIFNAKNDLESMNFEMFEEVVHNFDIV